MKKLKQQLIGEVNFRHDRQKEGFARLRGFLSEHASKAPGVLYAGIGEQMYGDEKGTIRYCIVFRDPEASTYFIAHPEYNRFQYFLKYNSETKTFIVPVEEFPTPIWNRLRKTPNHFIPGPYSYPFRQAFGYVRLLCSSRPPTPQIAVVLTGRNDNYMPNFEKRVRAVLRWHFRHFAHEAIFVEWNPPADRPLLSPALAKEFPALRAYVIPPSTHHRYCNNPNLPLMEYHAKNAGIRRAKSEWILATNCDIVIGPDVIFTLRKSIYQSSTIWDAHRFDIAWDDNAPEVRLKNFLGFQNCIPAIGISSGDFLLARRDLWHQTRGYDESLTRHRRACDCRGGAQMLSTGACMRLAGSVLHMQHPTSTSVSVAPHHGEAADLQNVPYENNSNWGLGLSEEEPLAERVWELK